MKELWERAIRRADELARQRPEAGELLGFYSGLLGAQQLIYDYLRGKKGWLPTGELAADLPIFRDTMTTLLKAVERSGPPALVEQARNVVSSATAADLDEMLVEYWRAPTDTDFFPKAFLQPYARWLADSGGRPEERDLEGGPNHCPFCQGKPQLTFLESKESSSEGGVRDMLCSLCLSTWSYRRVVCAKCGEEDPAKLVYYHTAEYDHVRVDACESCRYYIKSVDLTRYGFAVPLVDEMAAAPLDLWTRERGYTKIELNLVGL